MAETTTVTVMFTDVVGSTSLRQDQGEAVAHEMMGAHNDIVREQITEYAGQEVKTIGDSFMVAFDSARKAVDCAIAVQRALYTFNRRNPAQPMNVRIGLHTGEAIRDGNDLFGTSVDAAARIMAKADGGQIFVSEILKAVLGAAKDVDFKDAGRVRLKGFPDRWHLFEVGWRSELEAEVGATAAGRTPYIGRTEERATLRRLIERTTEGVGAVVLVSGEAGLGKTRLVEEAAAEARTRGVFVVRGHCYEMEGSAPYVPFVEAIEYGLSVVPRDEFRAAMGEAGPEIARFVPKVRVAFPDLPPPVALPTDQARHYMFESVCDFFEQASRNQPMVIVLEDLHWADESTTHLLESVARRVPDSGLLVIGTYRDVDLTAKDPFSRGIEHLTRLPAVSRIALKRLSVTEVGQMLAVLSGREPPVPLVQVIFEETEGVPFFVEEVYRHLLEEGRLTDATGRWLPGVEIGEVEVPETVRMVLGRRIERIGETAQRIMTSAACVGRAFTYEFLSVLVEDSDDDVLDALDDAERARLVVVEEGRNPRYLFAHEQIRQTLLARLSFVRRQRLHRHVADTLERFHADHVDEHVTDLAFHLAQGGASDRAAEYLVRAGASTEARLAIPEALAFYARAAELAGLGPTRRAALRARGGLLLGLYRGREATVDLQQAVNEAEADGAVEDELEALLRLGRALYVVGLDYGPAVEQSRLVIQRALQLAVQLGDPRAEARVLISTYRHVDFDSGYRPEAIANSERALAIARDLGDEDLEIDALRGGSMIVPIDVFVANRERIAASLERRGDLIGLNEHLFDLAWVLMLTARFDECVACTDRATEVAARLGIPPVQYGTQKALALIELGRFDDAWSALETEVVDDEHPFGQLFQRYGQVVWYSAAGDLERVIREVPRALADARALKRAWMFWPLQQLLAMAIVGVHEPGTPFAALEAEIEAAGAQLRDAALVEALLHSGDAATALERCDAQLSRVEAGRLRDVTEVHERRVRALLATGSAGDAVASADAALASVADSGWRRPEWRLRATLADALDAIGNARAGGERTAARRMLMEVASTLHDTTARARFLGRPEAAALLV